jgi:hypothetical protein
MDYPRPKAFQQSILGPLPKEDNLPNDMLALFRAPVSLRRRKDRFWVTKLANKENMSLGDYVRSFQPMNPELQGEGIQKYLTTDLVGLKKFVIYGRVNFKESPMIKAFDFYWTHRALLPDHDVTKLQWDPDTDQYSVMKLYLRLHEQVCPHKDDCKDPWHPTGRQVISALADLGERMASQFGADDVLLSRVNRIKAAAAREEEDTEVKIKRAKVDLSTDDHKAEVLESVDSTVRLGIGQWVTTVPWRSIPSPTPAVVLPDSPLPGGGPAGAGLNHAKPRFFNIFDRPNPTTFSRRSSSPRAVVTTSPHCSPSPLPSPVLPLEDVDHTLTPRPPLTPTRDRDGLFPTSPFQLLLNTESTDSPSSPLVGMDLSRGVPFTPGRDRADSDQ